MKVSYDTNLRLRLWDLETARRTIDATIARCDIALPSLDDSQQLTGLADARRHRRLLSQARRAAGGPEDGGRGLPDRHARQALSHCAAHRVEAVDATGAGDTFDGAFLARLLAGDDLEAAGRYANVAAALSTRGYGAVTPIPRAAEVLAELARG